MEFIKKYWLFVLIALVVIYLFRKQLLLKLGYAPALSEAQQLARQYFGTIWPDGQEMTYTFDGTLKPPAMPLEPRDPKARSIWLQRQQEMGYINE